MLQWMDDFSSYGTGDGGVARMTNGLYASVGANSPISLVADPDPSGDGRTVVLIGHNSVEGVTQFRKTLSSPQAIVGVAARFWFTKLPVTTSDRPRLASFRDISNVILCYVTANPTGYLEVYSGAGVLLAISDLPILVANAWRHIEIKALFNNMAGEIAIRVEGATVLSATGIPTTTGLLCHNFAFTHGRSSSLDVCRMYVKDYILWDGSGSHNNDFMGSCEVYKIVPDGDVSLGWDPSTGTTGFDLINEDTPDDDMSYISAIDPPPSPSQFTLTDVPEDVTSVRGVISFHRSRKTDGGDGSLQTSLVLATDEDAGQDRSITTAWTYWFDIYDQAPDGGNWTRQKADDLEIKVDRTT